MATIKPAEIEDKVLINIFLVTLTDADPKFLFLETMVTAILKEGKELLLSRTLIERMLLDRLCGHFSAAEPPFPYLIGCYRRAQDKSMKIQSMDDNNLRSAMEIVTVEAKKLTVSYSRHYLVDPDLSRGRRDKKKSGWYARMMKINMSLILPLILAESHSGASHSLASSSSEVQSPPGFLDEFFDSDFESLYPILEELYDDLMATVLNVYVLGEFQPSLKALKYLVSLPFGPKSLVNHKNWVPQTRHRDG